MFLEKIIFKKCCLHFKFQVSPEYFCFHLVGQVEGGFVVFLGTVCCSPFYLLLIYVDQDLDLRCALLPSLSLHLAPGWL